MDESPVSIGQDRLEAFFSRYGAEKFLTASRDHYVRRRAFHVSAARHPSDLGIMPWAPVAAGYPQWTPAAPEGLQPAQKLRLEAHREAAGTLKLPKREVGRYSDVVVIHGGLPRLWPVSVPVWPG